MPISHLFLEQSRASTATQHEWIEGRCLCGAVPFAGAHAAAGRADPALALAEDGFRPLTAVAREGGHRAWADDVLLLRRLPPQRGRAVPAVRLRPPRVRAHRPARPVV